MDSESLSNSFDNNAQFTINKVATKKGSVSIRFGHLIKTEWSELTDSQRLCLTYVWNYVRVLFCCVYCVYTMFTERRLQTNVSRDSRPRSAGKEKTEKEFEK